MKAKLKRNTPTEEAAVQRGIAVDPDAAEWTAADFARARPAAAVLPPAVYGALQSRRRGPGAKPNKVQVTLRLDHATLAALRASGKGWQSRAGDALTRLAGLGSSEIEKDG
jgi:uncharacterized protein (DUF4415 family)